MFEDLIPAASAQTPAPPPPGLFDDLIPAGGATGAVAAGLSAVPGRPDGLASAASTAGTDAGNEETRAREGNEHPAASFPNLPPVRNENASRPGLFDDLIPARAASGAVLGGISHAFAPEYEPVPDPSLGLKDAKTGIPLVRESQPGRFIAEVAGEDDGGLFWKDPETGEIRRPGADELIRPEGGKFKVYERHEIVRPWTVADMALVRAIVSGFTAAHDAFAGNMAPNEVIPRAVDFAMLGFGGARTPVTTWRPRGPVPPPRPEFVEEGGSRSFANGETRGAASADPNAVPGETGTQKTGPPPDPLSSSQSGAPSGAVSVSEPPQVLRLPSSRLTARPNKRGNAPIGDDGYPVELHHHSQVQNGRLREMTQTEHRRGENYRLNHPNTGQRPSLIDRLRSKRDRYGHWSGDWDEGRFDNLPGTE